ncbi:MAG: hypothetical protein AAF541_21300 [Pseudomonadota bacterium]
MIDELREHLSGQSFINIGVSTDESTDWVFTAQLLRELAALPNVTLKPIQRDGRPPATKLSIWASLLKKVDLYRRRAQIHQAKQTCLSLLNIDDGAACPDLDLVLNATSSHRTTTPDAQTWSLWFRTIEGDAEGSQLPLVFLSSSKAFEIVLSCYDDVGEELQFASTCLRMPPSLSYLRLAHVAGKTAAQMLCWEIFGRQQRPAATSDARPRSFPAGENRSVSGVKALGRVCTFGLNQVAGRLQRTFKSPVTRSWQVGIRQNPPNEPWSDDWVGYTWVDATPGNYLADPFLFKFQDTTWLFAEEYVGAQGKGVLGCGQLDAQGQLASWQTILDLPYHLSFPHVFHHDGDIYMIPESAEGGCVDLYRCMEFPSRWQKIKTLWDEAGLDTVPFKHSDGLWYFFTTKKIDKAVPGELLLFYAESLDGQWHLHRSSPLSLDARYARNAGRILRMKDSEGHDLLLRVSQDETGNYGSRLHFRQITQLSQQTYIETHLATRDPLVGHDGSHHLERLEHWEATDLSS